jgi:uncharacterized damage-inducible protein DinB
VDLRRHAGIMARYHQWATSTLYRELDRLDEASYRRELGLFFGSIHATLNHLLVVDHLWHARLVGEPHPYAALNAQAEADRGRLRERLLARGSVWSTYLDGLSDADLAGMADFRKVDGTPARLPRASCVLHVFNHGTHHRGQISAALTQLGGQAPEMDLPFYFYSLPPEARET